MRWGVHPLSIALLDKESREQDRHLKKCLPCRELQKSMNWKWTRDHFCTETAAKPQMSQSS